MNYPIGITQYWYSEKAKQESHLPLNWVLVNIAGEMVPMEYTNCHQHFSLCPENCIPESHADAILLAEYPDYANIILNPQRQALKEGTPDII